MAFYSTITGKAIVLAGFAFLHLAGAASAEITLEPADSRHLPAGPAKAAGAVIWSHGRSITMEDSTSPSPPYIDRLRDAGYDAFRLNRTRDSDTLANSSRALVEHVERLRLRGYRRIVLAGQSFGAFISLIAAGSSDQIDAVIATAPAAYGNFNDAFDSWRANASQLYPLLAGVRRARVMLFFFHGDEFDPGGRGDHARTILARRGIRHLVVDQPADLVGHGAAASGLFVRRFSTCMLAFIEAPLRPDEIACDQSWGRSPAPELLAVAGGQSRSQTVPTGARPDLIGRWHGFYGNGREVILAIDHVEGSRVEASYTLGPGIRANQQAETVRRIGTISGDTLRFAEPGMNILQYTLRPDGKLKAGWIAADESASLDAVMRRLPEALRSARMH